LTAQEQKEIEASESFLDFFKHSSKLVERALSVSYDIAVDYEHYSEDEGEGYAAFYYC